MQLNIQNRVAVAGTFYASVNHFTMLEKNMPTESIFTDFSIKDKKTARAFIKALEESAADPRPATEVDCSLLLDREALKKRFKHLKP